MNLSNPRLILAAIIAIGCLGFLRLIFSDKPFTGKNIDTSIHGRQLESPQQPQEITTFGGKDQSSPRGLSLEARASINQIVASAFSEVIVPWEIRASTYRFIEPSESAEALVVVIPPFAPDLQSRLEEFLHANLTLQFSETSIDAAKDYAYKKIGTLYDKQLFTQVSFSLKRDNDGGSPSYDEIKLDFAVSDEQFQPNSIGISRSSTAAENEERSTRISNSPFYRRSDSLVAISGPLESGELHNRYRHLFRVQEVE